MQVSPLLMKWFFLKHKTPFHNLFLERACMTLDLKRLQSLSKNTFVPRLVKNGLVVLTRKSKMNTIDDILGTNSNQKSTCTYPSSELNLCKKKCSMRKDCIFGNYSNHTDWEVNSVDLLDVLVFVFVSDNNVSSTRPQFSFSDLKRNGSFFAGCSFSHKLKVITKYFFYNENEFNYINFSTYMYSIQSKSPLIKPNPS